MSKKVKIKDLTKTQYMMWMKDNCKSNKPCSECIFGKVACETLCSGAWLNVKELFSEEFLNQEIEFEETILTHKEKVYLKGIIEGLNPNITCVQKAVDSRYEEYTELIFYREEPLHPSIISIPSREPIFKGMELYEKYTLKELGLK